MKLSKKDILLALIDHYAEGNKARFAKLLGITPQSVSTWLARSTYDAELIYSKCKDVSAGWLLSGEGSMFQVKEGEVNLVAKQAIYDLTMENTRLKNRIAELEDKKGFAAL